MNRHKMKRKAIEMTKTVFKVDGMSCGHCVKSITKAVGALDGVFGVTADLSAKTVTVEHDPGQASTGKIKSGIEEQGFEVMEP